MAVTGWKTGTSASGWTNSQNALARDGISATAAGALLLTISGYDFTEIPASANIDGIEMIWRKQGGNFYGVIFSTDTEVTITTALGKTVDKKAAGNWEQVMVDFPYGGPSDTWGQALTGADVQSLVTNNKGGISFGGTSLTDVVELRITYTPTGPGDQLFDATATGNSTTNAALVVPVSRYAADVTSGSGVNAALDVKLAPADKLFNATANGTSNATASFIATHPAGDRLFAADTVATSTASGELYVPLEGLTVVQRYSYNDISALSTVKTFDTPINPDQAVVRVSNTAYVTGGEPGTNLPPTNANVFGVWISDITSTTYTINRTTTDVPNQQVEIEVMEFLGDGDNDPNGWKVLETGTFSPNFGTNQQLTLPIPNATDLNKVVVYCTGVGLAHRTNIVAGQQPLMYINAGNLNILFQSVSDTRPTVSYSVVEYTGSNYTVSFGITNTAEYIVTLSDAYDGVGGNTATVPNWDNAVIFGTWHAPSDEGSSLSTAFEPYNATTVSLSPASYRLSRTRIYVLYNPEMDVQRRSSDIFSADPHIETIDEVRPEYTSLMCMMESFSTEVMHAIWARNYRLTSSTTVEYDGSTNPNSTLLYRTQAVQWPVPPVTHRFGATVASESDVYAPGIGSALMYAQVASESTVVPQLLRELVFGANALGTTSASAKLGYEYALGADSNSTGTVTAAFVRDKGFETNVLGTSITSARIGRDRPFTANVDSASNATAFHNSIGLAELYARINSASNITGAFLRDVPFTANTLGTTDATAYMQRGVLFASDITSNSNATASALREATFACNSNGTSTASANLLRGGEFQTTVLASSTISGSMEVDNTHLFGSNVTSSSNATADMQRGVLFTSDITSSSNASVDMQRGVLFTSDITSNSNALADMQRGVLFASDISGTANASADMQRGVLFASDINGTANADGALSNVIVYDSTTTSESNVNVNVKIVGAHAFAASPTGTSNVYTELSRDKLFAAFAEGNAKAHAIVQSDFNFRSSINSVSSTTVKLGRDKHLSGELDSASAATVDEIHRDKNFNSNAQATSGMTSFIVRTQSFDVSCTATTNTAASVLNVVKHFASTTSGTTDLESNMSLVRNMAATIASETTIHADEIRIAYVLGTLRITIVETVYTNNNNSIGIASQEETHTVEQVESTSVPVGGRNTTTIIL